MPEFNLTETEPKQSPRAKIPFFSLHSFFEYKQTTKWKVIVYCYLLPFHTYIWSLVSFKDIFCNNKVLSSMQTFLSQGKISVQLRTHGSFFFCIPAILTRLFHIFLVSGSYLVGLTRENSGGFFAMVFMFIVVVRDDVLMCACNHPTYSGVCP